ncbi:MAG: DUF2935 domain-containing protein [Bacillota bacterium]
MLSKLEYVRQSLELHLFFARIMKEHAFFLETAFTQKNGNHKTKACIFRVKFDELLSEALALSYGVIGPDAAAADEIVTPYTLNAELATRFYTGTPINTDITQKEMIMVRNIKMAYIPKLEDKVFVINQNAIIITAALIKFKRKLLKGVLSCKQFTFTYPSLIDHTIEEAKLYIKMLQKLQKYEYIDSDYEFLEQELFWNEIMSEHADFIRGFLDPMEEELIETAGEFAREFKRIIQEAKSEKDQTFLLTEITKKSLELTMDLIEFKTKGIKGLLGCKIRSVILPLLADHTLREANHYLRILRMSKR